MAARRQTKTGGRPATKGVIPGRYALSVGRPPSPAPEDWEWVPLSTVARLETGHTPSRKHPEYWDGDVPWIGIRDATDNHGRTIHDTYQHTNAEGITNSSARILPKHTVCLSRTASVGYVVVMGRPMATSQDFVNWVCSEDLDYRYLKAVLMAEHETYAWFAHGTTHQTIYFPEVKAFHICLPPRGVQERIGDTLESLEQRIELNRRMSRTLEAIARAIFKSWFVDFDPVHAKLEGREPVGMDPATAALFPDSFQDSPLGKIPKGWEVSTVGKEFRLTMGQSPPGSTYNEKGEGMPFFQGRRDFGLRFPTQRVYCTAPKRVAEEGDTLVSVRAPVGDVNMAPVQLCLGRGLAGVRHSSGSRSYTYCSMLSLQERFRVFESEGTVFGAINKGQFSGLDWVNPGGDLVKLFEELLSPLDESIRANALESSRLESVRDSLLPRLLAGSLEVTD